MGQDLDVARAARTLADGVALLSTIEDHCVCFWQTEFTPAGDVIRRNTGRGLERLGISNADTIGTRAEDWPGIDYYWRAKQVLIANPTVPYVVFDADQNVYGGTIEAPPLMWLASITRWFEGGRFVGLSILQIAREWAVKL